MNPEPLYLFTGSPNRLAIFLIDSSTGSPLTLRPVMAEVVVPCPPVLRPGQRDYEDLLGGIYEFDNQISPEEHARVAAVMKDTYARVLTDTAQDQLAAAGNRMRQFSHESLQRVTDQSSTRLGAMAPTDLPSALDAAMRATAADMGLQTRSPDEVNTPKWSNPLGVLTTDPAGYVSFDLTRLRPDARALLDTAIQTRQSDPTIEPGARIYIQPLGQQPTDVLTQARFGADAIVGLVRADGEQVPVRQGGGQALQNPSLTDWLLSPGSFASNPAGLVGDGGCEQIYPATLALYEFVVRQVVRLTDGNDVQVPDPYKPAYVDEYLVTWSSLGHSLGEVLYSLPLAPGETVRLAAIDWSWDSDTARTEQTTESEDLRHDTHRDRVIDETVKAALKEHQSGSSIMGGMAHSLGASGSANWGILGLGAASGDTNSIGGATASTDGSRDLTADNVQRLSDSFAQASTSQRQLNSTVVIQAEQAEKETIQTRTFTNYNHAHTLTVLYHEVLRHYRVTTKWIRRRPAVLIPRPTYGWDSTTLRQYRPALEAALLDPLAQPGFDALEQLLLVETDDAYNPAQGPVPIVQQKDWQFAEFEITTNVADNTSGDPVWLYAERLGQPDIQMVEGTNPNINSNGRFQNRQTTTFTVRADGGQPIRWGDLIGFHLSRPQGADPKFLWVCIVGISTAAPGGQIELRPPNSGEVHLLQADTNYFVSITAAGPDVPQPATAPTGRRRLTMQQNGAIARLTEHIQAFPEYYSSVRYFGRPAVDVAKELAGLSWNGTTVLDHVEPTPLEMFGSDIAYPLAGGTTAMDSLSVDLASALDGADPTRRQWAIATLARLNEEDQQNVAALLSLASSRAERLVTLPTRGVFAEGHLGHCNVAEEIDNTRFWKWEEHPLPIEAPEIAPVTPVTPAPQNTAVSPTPFPQSLVNIVSPTAAPDPVGLSAALKLLGTPNIFRDMSGESELTDLLKKLSDNTISIAEAANKAREIQAKLGSGAGSSGGSGGSTTPKAGLGANRTTPADRSSTTTQDLQDLQHVLSNAQGKNLLTADDARNAYTNALQNAYAPPVTDVSYPTPGGGSGTGGTTSTPISSATDAQLAEAAAVVFFNAVDIDNYFTDVTGQPFEQWFRNNLAGRSSWAGFTLASDATTQDRFITLWNAVPAVVGSDHGDGTPSITLPELATLLAIMLHETGPDLNFRGAEGIGNAAHLGLAYAFERFLITPANRSEQPFWKASYNLSNGNRTAYECFHDPGYLKVYGTLQPTSQTVRDLPAWSGKDWPQGVPTTKTGVETAFLQEADFYKFRGRGTIQSTGRGAYLPIVRYVRGYSGDDTNVLDVQQRWNDIATAVAGQGTTITTDDQFAFISSNMDWDKLFQSILIQVVALRGHNNIAGKHYLPMSSDPTVLRGTGRGSASWVAQAISGRDPRDDSYPLDVRSRMLEFIGTLWKTPMPPLGGTVNL
ncbi:hypothetical protein [Mycobacterium sp. 155]|uniref:hypothetical protein n=1 Tax=Mycobacterium sp. 155 TaxID=1157943 RepID=UPI0003610B13|nr:hypothetical protein [Mycobacterium sp. 155]